MSYVITDGNRYCHRTKTRAVEIVNDLDSATRFANRDMAQNILQRATKKLSGFYLMDLNSETKPSAAAKKESRSQEKKTGKQQDPKAKVQTKRRSGRKAAQEAAETKAQETAETRAQEATEAKAQEAAETKVQEQKKPVSPEAESQEATAAPTSPADSESKSRKRTHRGGRRKKNASSEAQPENVQEAAAAGSDEKTAGQSEKNDGAREPAVREDTQNESFGNAAPVPDTKESLPGSVNASVLPPSFKVVVHSTSASSSDRQSAGKEAVSGKKEEISAAVSESTEPAALQEPEEDHAQTPDRGQNAVREKKNARGRGGRRKAVKEAAAESPLPVIPMFTVETHHVSENAVAKPVRKATANAASNPVSDAGQASSAAASEEAAATANASASEGTPAAEQSGRRQSRPGQSGKPERGSHSDNGRRGRGTSQKTDADPEAANVQDKMDKAEGEKSSDHSDSHLTIETAYPGTRGEVQTDQNTGYAAESDRTAGSPARNGRGRGGRGRNSQNNAGASSLKESSSGRTSSETVSTRSGEGRTRTRGGRSKAISTTEAKRRIFTQQERYEIYNRTEGHCGICGKFIPLGEYTIDHIIPLSKGGTNDLDNLQACCSFCNKAKDDSMGDDFFQRIENIFLYQAQLKYGKKKLKKLRKTLDEIEA